MPFNLGFLGSNPPPAAPAGGRGGGAATYANTMNMLADNRRQDAYLEAHKKDVAYAHEQNWNKRVEKQMATRQAAIDGWLAAVRSGNRADVWMMGKKLNSMGINVQMPSAFSATGVPGAGDLPAAPGTPGAPAATTLDDELGSTVEEPNDPYKAAADKKTAAGLDAMSRESAAKVAPASPALPPEPPMGPLADMAQFAPTRPDGTPIDLDIARRAYALGPGTAPGTTTSGTPIASPFGPGGPSAGKAPTTTWKVHDPITGTNIEISPEEIVQDQQKEISQSFGPLVEMNRDDPVAQRAYAIGHEFAMGQIGHASPKEAIAGGMAAADRYMTHMYQMGMVDAARLKAMKGARGGGGGGGGGIYDKPGKARSTLANQVVDNARATISSVKTSNNYLGRQKAIDAGAEVLKSFDQNTGVGDHNALGQYIKSISGAATTDKERGFYMGAAGVVPRLENIYNQYARDGHLSPTLMAELRRLKEEVDRQQRKKQDEIVDRAAEAAADEADFQFDEAGVDDPKTRNKARTVIRGMVGGERQGAGKGAPKAKSKTAATPTAIRLLK